MAEHLHDITRRNLQDKQKRRARMPEVVESALR
jgi:hypothetical protein